MLGGIDVQQSVSGADPMHKCRSAAKRADARLIVLWRRLLGSSRLPQPDPSRPKSQDAPRCGMRREFSFPNKTSAREEGAELFSLLSSPDSVASVFVCQIDEVETKFLSANSISEFSHSLGP
jgi:hypothetical protein